MDFEFESDTEKLLEKYGNTQKKLDIQAKKRPRRQALGGHSPTAFYNTGLSDVVRCVKDRKQCYVARHIWDSTFKPKDISRHSKLKFKMCTKNEGLARVKIFTSSQAKAWHLDEVCALNLKRQLQWALYCSRRFSSVFRDQSMTYTLCRVIEEVAIQRNI